MYYSLYKDEINCEPNFGDALKQFFNRFESRVSTITSWQVSQNGNMVMIKKYIKDLKSGICPLLTKEADSLLLQHYS